MKARIMKPSYYISFKCYLNRSDEKPDILIVKEENHQDFIQEDQL